MSKWNEVRYLGGPVQKLKVGHQPRSTIPPRRATWPQHLRTTTSFITYDKAQSKRPAHSECILTKVLHSSTASVTLLPLTDWPVEPIVVPCPCMHVRSVYERGNCLRGGGLCSIIWGGVVGQYLRSLP